MLYNEVVMKTQQEYFLDFLKVTPMSLAIWRCGEAAVLHRLFKEWKEPVLDLGCGFGEFMGVFYDGQIEIGIDINNKDLVQAARRKKYRECKWADARHLPYQDNSIQTVVSVSVLEHIPHVEKVFTEVYRVLKPGGYFVFTVPTVNLNRRLLGSRFLRALHLPKLAQGYETAFHSVFKHPNVFKETEWIKLTTRAGFKLLITKPTLTIKQLQIFEWGLLAALPSQISRMLFGRRWIMENSLRPFILGKVLRTVLNSSPTEPLNIAVIGKKL